MPFDIVLLVIVLFGLLTSYTDIKEGKIKNQHVLLLLGAAIFVNVLITKAFLEKPFETLMNFAATLLLSFGMYYRNLWSEGDAKLFSAFVLLIPVTSYVYFPLNFFPALNILINTFVPAAVFFVIASVRKGNYPKIKESFRNTFSLRNILESALFLFGFAYAVGSAAGYLGIDIGIFGTVFVLIILLEVLRKFNVNVFYLSIPFSIARVFLVPLDIEFLYGFAIMLAAFALLRFLINFAQLTSVKSKGKKKIPLKTSFAPFLFFGVLFTYLTGSDLFFLVFSFLNSF